MVTNHLNQIDCATTKLDGCINQKHISNTYASLHKDQPAVTMQAMDTLGDHGCMKGDHGGGLEIEGTLPPRAGTCDRQVAVPASQRSTASQRARLKIYRRNVDTKNVRNWNQKDDRDY